MRQEQSPHKTNFAMAILSFTGLCAQLALLSGCESVTHSLGVLPKPAQSINSGGSAPLSGGGLLVETGGSVASGGSPGSGGALATCDLIDAEPSRAQLIVIQDSSFTVPIDSGFFNPIPEGIGLYGQDPRSHGSRVSLHVTQGCGALPASVPLGFLPDNANMLSNAVANAFDFAEPHGAISSALLEFGDAVTLAPADDKFGIAIVTDGFPGGGCPGTTEEAVAGGPAHTPPIDIFIVELTAGPVNWTDWLAGASADELAVAGGTMTAVSADVFSTGPARQVNEALQHVRSEIQPCDITITRGDDPSHLAIAVDGQAISELGTADDCSESGGYYLKTPGDLLGGVTLCDASCDSVRIQGLLSLNVSSNCD